MRALETVPSPDRDGATDPDLFHAERTQLRDRRLEPCRVLLHGDDRDADGEAARQGQPDGRGCPRLAARRAGDPLMNPCVMRVKGERQARPGGGEAIEQHFVEEQAVGVELAAQAQAGNPRHQLGDELAEERFAAGELDEPEAQAAGVVDHCLAGALGQAGGPARPGVGVTVEALLVAAGCQLEKERVEAVELEGALRCQRQSCLAGERSEELVQRMVVGELIQNAARRFLAEQRP